MLRGALRPLFAALLAVALACGCHAAPRAPPLGLSAARRAHAASRRGVAPPRAALRHPRASDEQLGSCTASWFETDIDHFSWVRCTAGLDMRHEPLTRLSQAPVGTFSLRYFMCGLEQWQATPDGQPGPVFFYAGNVRCLHRHLAWSALTRSLLGG
jgi:hypothetical protein